MPDYLSTSATIEEDEQRVFVGKLHTLLQRGHITYKNYLSNKKIFLYAKILKDNNDGIRQLILTHCHILPAEQQVNAIQLVSHIDAWSCLWEDLYERLTPKPSDVFTFENDNTFPTKAADALISYYLDISDH